MQTFVHESLGTLSWDADDEVYKTKVQVAGGQVDMDIVLDGSEVETKVLVDQAARKLRDLNIVWQQIQTRISELLQDAVAAYNDSSPNADAAAMPHLKLMSYSVYADGSSELFFSDDAIDDEGLFAGHYVIANLSPELVVTEASLAG